MKNIIQKSLIILAGFGITENAFSQSAPNISYSTPQTFTVGTPITPLTVTNSGGAVAINGQTSTFAGSGTAGSTNGTGTGASFYEPIGTALDAAGNVYVADYANNLIRKITSAGVVTTLAGSGTAGFANGTGTAASFYLPFGVAVDAIGNVYVADRSNNMVRMITPSGVVSTLAGSGTAGSANGTGSAATFNQPLGVAVDAYGNVFVADYGNSLIREITPGGVVTTFAGSGAVGYADGTGTAAIFYNPSGLAFDPSGNLYVVDHYNNMIRKITSAGVVTTLAGATTAGFADGTGTSARFSTPTTVATDAAGNVYVADYGNNRIRKITPAGVVTTLAGTGTASAVNGAGSVATFKNPYGVSLDAAGNIYLGDFGNNLIRKIATTAFVATTTLPAGLTLNGATGAISGTPTTASSSASYSITAYNLTGSSTANITITVNAAPPVGINPTSTMNYIATYVPRVSGIITSTGLDSAITDKTKIQASIQYFDGLGKPIQAVQVKASPTGHDVVQPIVYDSYEREITKYLPYALTGSATNDGSYKTTVVTDQGTFYNAPPTGVSTDTYPYSQVNLEASPLSRPVENGAPGAAWQLSTSGVTGSGHTVKTIYTGNNSITWATDSVHSMQVAMYKTTINSNQSRTLTASGYYAANQLNVTVTEDENWVSGRAGTMETYTDNEGHVVLKRVYGLNNYSTTLQQLSTYYVYDDLGNLAYVIPPAANGDAAITISATTLNNLCYQYRYDTRNRLSQKKIPGKGWEFVVYNIIDQPVASQDSLQRNNNNWILTKYDALGRVALTGIWNNNNVAVSQPSLQTTLTAITTNLWEAPTTSGNGYTNIAWPTTYVTTTLGINYYDSYTNIPGLLATYHLTSGVSTMLSGLLTAKRTAVLNTPTDMLWDVVYYDDLGRTITTYNQHYLGGTANTNNYDLTKTTYNFTNAPTTVTRQHWNTASTSYPLVTIANSYIYDHMGRKLKSWEQITNGSSSPTTKILLSQIDYNEIGQPITKHLHSTDSVNFFQNIAYTYNERGWLVTSSAPMFAMQLYYNTGTNKQYNGNIAYQLWGTPGSLTKSYTYLYDKLNRLTAGTSGDHNDESSIFYDVMGNITAMGRTQASVTIDNLSYTYTVGGNPTNQLQSINDVTTNDAGLKHGISNFTYDGNGNLITDPTKGTGITIAYNMLNLPQSITGGKTITYTYDATGQKLRRVSPVTGNTDYISGIQYDGTTTSSLTFIQTEEGKAVPNGTGYDYEYYLGDNLGNTRVTFGTKTGTAVSYQQDDYYPFGMEISRSVLSPKNEYLYNKKELQEELSEYDYGARLYDPVIARWNTIDPHADKGRNKSAYEYASDNPINRVDPDGMDDFTVNKETGAVKDVKKNDQPDRILQTDSKGKIQKKGEGFLGFLVRKSERGKDKVAVDGIQSGFLKDGANLKDKSSLFSVGGKGQPTVAGFQDFAIKLSNYLDKEVSGFYLSNKGEESTSMIYMNGYKGNKPQEANSGFDLYKTRPDLINNIDIGVNYHTHLSRFGENDRYAPSGSRGESGSGGDMDIKKAQLRDYPSMKFIIITTDQQGETVTKDYTNY